MKSTFFILLSMLCCIQLTDAQNKKRSIKKTKKARGSYEQLPIAKNIKLDGPRLVDMSKLIYQEDTSKNNYHNEQDNFRPNNMAPKNPAQLAPTPVEGNPKPTIVIPNTDKEVLKKTRVTPAITGGFDGEICASNIPPDNSMAISNGGKIVSAVNCGIFFYGATGNSLGTATYGSIFNVTGSGWSDPRVLYDVYTDRFILFVQFGSTPSTSKLYIAFSTSNNPNSTWNTFSITASQLSANNWFDYPSVGINENDFCFSGNMFSSSNQSADNCIVLVDKTGAYAGNNPTIKLWNNVQDGQGSKAFTITPASAGRNISYNNIFHLVATRPGGGTYVTKFTINGKATDTAPTLTATDVSTSQQYYPSDAAKQPNGIDLANYKAGCRVQASIFVDNNILFVFPANYNDGSNDFNSIYYNALNVTSNVLNQSWSFLAGSSYNYPCLASFGNSNTDKAIILGFLKSDANTNPEIRFKYFDNQLAQLASVQARQGDDAVNYTWANEQRWGDYMGMQMKYNAASPEVWLGGSYGNSGNKWQTYIGKVTGYPGAVSIQETDLYSSGILVYPNPVISLLNIKGDFNKITGFPTIYNSEGKLVKIDMNKRNQDLMQLDVNNLATGQYIVRFSNGQSLKFVKQ